MTYFLGLTGGIATGKSAASTLFKTLGVPVIDADQVAHQVMAENQTVKEQIAATFGDSLVIDGQVDRHKLGQLVFGQPTALAQLNAITAPVIRQALIAQMAAIKQAPVVVVDIPLLYEQGYAGLFDGVAVVAVSHATQLARLMARNQLTAEAAELRIASQLPLAEKRAQADYILENEGSLATLQAQIDSLLTKITD